MFDLKKNSKGEKVLVYVKRHRNPFERGLWAEICHESHVNAERFVELNRKMGLQVEKDENGFYRSLVLKD